MNIENLFHNIRQPSQEQKIALPNRDGYEFHTLSNLFYIAALKALIQKLF